MLWRKLNQRVLCLGLLLAGPTLAQTMFTEVTKEAINVPLPEFRGVAVGDYDNDGWPDVFLTAENSVESPTSTEFIGPAPRFALFHNKGNGRFAEAPTIRDTLAGLYQIRKGPGAIFGDYDNDGDLDLFLPHEGFYNGASPNVLLRNDQGRFVNVAREAGLERFPVSTYTSNAIWLDCDRDGYLDLYETSVGSGNVMNHNNRDGTFTDVTKAVGLDVDFDPKSGRVIGTNGGVVASDFNDDGWPDLYVGSWGTPNRLFLNDGQGHFVDATTKEIADEGEANGVAVGDIDNDLDLEIFQVAGGAFANLLNSPNRSLMLLNLGQGQFLDVTEGVGLAATFGTQNRGAGLADIDNDGDLDLMVTDPLFLFVNNEGAFVDRSSQTGITNAGTTPAFVDFDLDGDLDLVLSSNSPGPFWTFGGVYRNTGNNHHWLEVELVGVESNRNGIGARLIATAGSQRQRQDILGGRGFQEDNLTAHFGLADRATVDQLEIRWPSGRVEVLSQIPADQKIRVFEGRQEYYTIQPSTWQQALPDTVVDGTPIQVQALVRPALFEQEARIVRVTGDFSDMGGGFGIPLTDLGDGTYGLETQFAADCPNGLRTLSVLIEQTTSLGPYWTRLSKSIIVLPSEDLVILGEGLDPGWRVEGEDGGEVVAVAQPEVVYQGQSAAAFGVSSNGTTWRIRWLPGEAVDTLAYRALRFAFHPGGARGSKVDRLRVSVNMFSVDLVQGEYAVDLARQEWQVVKVPLEVLHVAYPITRIELIGNLNGAFYLDDLRLVAATPPPVTVVEEEHTASLPHSFSLSQNFPNPFNSETVIHFALPESGEVELAVYNLAGQQVVKLVEGAREAGSYAVRWDGRDEQGHELASGVYLYRLRAGERMETRKLVLVR